MRLAQEASVEAAETCLKLNVMACSAPSCGWSGVTSLGDPPAPQGGPTVPTWAGLLPGWTSSQEAIITFSEILVGIFAPQMLAGATNLVFGCSPSLQVIKHLSEHHCPTTNSMSSGWH